MSAEDASPDQAVESMKQPGTEELDRPLPLFEDGQRIAGRYEVLRFIDRGGVGEVYEVRDQELKENVALKVLRQDVAAQETVERFKREINLARQVTHPNVCRIYEFGQETRHRGRFFFLTMELLGGETLYDRVRRLGPMKPEDALPLVRQMADGLEAAQRAGVIHRDFKSSNVVLCEAPEAPSGLRAVVTDFGLARAAQEEVHHRVTAKDSMIGTPAYMAPEQVEGGQVTAATDIYAVGVVLYEMLTGRYPFEGDTAISTALKRLHETPTTPRSHVRHLPIRWEAAILRCLERDPRRRFASPRELVESLEGKGRIYPMRLTARRYAGWSATALLLLATMWLVASRWRLEPLEPEIPNLAPNLVGPTAPKATPSTPFEARRSLALLGFRNLSGKATDDWLATALSELLATEAAAGERIRVVPGEKVARARQELGMDASGDFAGGPVDRLAALLGSDLVVVGSYMAVGEGSDRPLRLDVEIRDTASGVVRSRFEQRGTEAAVLDLVEAVGQDLRQALGVASLSAEDQAQLRAVVPAGTEAVRLYAEGLELLRRYEAKAALQRLERAAELDPENARIRTAMSSAWLSLGHWPRAREEAQKAYQRSKDLPRQDRLWVEAQYFEIARKREQAMENYADLWAFFPDNLEYGLQLTKIKITMGRPDEALETIAELRGLPAPSGDDPRIELVAADTARAMSLYPKQQQHAAAAAAKAEALGDRFLVARARETEAAAWRDLGEPEKAQEAYEHSRSLYAATNNRGLVARVLVASAKLDRHQGNLERAKETLQEASSIAEEIGDQGSLKHGLNTLAIILRQQGELREAQEMHLQELAANREIGDHRGEQITLTSLGVVERQLGDLDAAEGHFSQALAVGREIQSQRSVAINLNLLGEVKLRRGHVAEAYQHFEEALEANEQLGNKRGEAYYYTSLAAVARARGDAATARKLHEDALQIRRDINEQTNVANSLISLAELDLDAGDGAAAAAKLRLAAEEFQRESKQHDEALALALLSRAEWLEGQKDTALAAAERAVEQVEDEEHRGMQLQVWVESAGVLAGSGQNSRAIGQLRRARQQAERLGFVDLRLRAELELSRLLVDSDAEEASALRHGVEQEARRLGFLQLADWAGAPEGSN